MRYMKMLVYGLTVLMVSVATLGIYPAGAADSLTDQHVAAARLEANVYQTTGGDDGAVPLPPQYEKNHPENEGGEIEGNPLLRDEFFYSKRLAGDPSANFSMEQAATLRAKAAEIVANEARQPAAPSTFNGAWQAAGPNPMVLSGRFDSSFDAMAGRIGALAIRSSAPYTLYLGGAQGGVWEMAYPYTGTWTPKTDALPSLAIGALALAPSNENIVYVGTGEGALSGDSYFGNGVLKSTDGGNSFVKISAAGYFTSVSISKIVVDKTNPNTLYVGTLRGRGGARRTSPPNAAPFGVWKSTDGGVNWSLVLTASTNPLALAGVTDLALDPQNSQVIYASLLGQGISKTVNGGQTWATAMTGLPANANYALAPTRFALGISHPSSTVSATLYSGFEWYDNSSAYHPSTVWKSTDEGGHWAETTTAVVSGYCGSAPDNTQCTYDNVIGVDPITPTIVYALGLYNYDTGSGGIYRSANGGSSWIDLGANLHPDYHAIAIRQDNSAHVVIGNDGGVWYSSNRGGRLSPSDPLTATTWVNLNGAVNPADATVLHRTDLQLGQATSIATNPVIPNRFYEGTQDNGTQRKSTASQTWFDVSSGDGGQVLVDPANANYVYGTYYGIRPYRFTEGGGLYFGGTSNQFIRTGLDLADRSEFYIPWIMDPADSNRLYLGTYRVYRTDNARATNAADVIWKAVSGDLTSGCTGTAPNGARGCVISAFGVTAGAPAVYVGTLDGKIWLSTNSTSAAPTWTELDGKPVNGTGTLPNRPIAAIAVDNSNYRVAYVAYNGFNAATPSSPGHVFKTTNAGQSWTDVSGNMPDVPVNSIVLDSANPNVLYIGTDVGPMISTSGGASWFVHGTGFPIVAINQVTLNPFTRQLVAGTHGRGAWYLDDSATLLPALSIRVSSNTGIPVGPNSLLTYSITVKNSGNTAATYVSIQNPIPANTTFVSAGSGGTLSGNQVVWSLPSIGAASVITTGGTLGVGRVDGSVTVSLTVRVASSGVSSGSVITDDNVTAAAAEVPAVTASPYPVVVAPANSVSLTPASQQDGTRSGQVITYVVSVNNMGYSADKFNLSTTGNNWPTTFWNAAHTAQITQTDSLNPGASANVIVQVSVPANASNGTVDTATVKATSVGNPAVSATAQIKTIAVTLQVLLVDDSGQPDIAPIYKAALSGANVVYNFWDLAASPVIGTNYLKAHAVIVWYTGPAYPDPIGPYETQLANFLDHGGRLFMSGQDILDQSAGTAPFVLNYLHVLWDGTDRFNDTGTFTVTGVVSNPVTSSFGPTPLDFTILGGVDFSDVITPTAPAIPAFTGSYGKPQFNGLPDALTVDTGTYKVMFLAFPFETLGTPADRSNLMSAALTWFGSIPRFTHRSYLPVIYH